MGEQKKKKKKKREDILNRIDLAKKMRTNMFGKKGGREKGKRGEEGKTNKAAGWRVKRRKCE